MKEADQVEKRGEGVWVVASETLGIGWSFLQGVGAPKEILLAGPSPSITDTTAQELFTRELEVLRTVDVWCTSCGGSTQRDAQCAIQEDAGSVRKAAVVSPTRSENTRENSQGPGWTKLNL
jgi:hypothetical protein